MIPGGVIPLLFSAETLPFGSGASGGSISDITDNGIKYRVHQFFGNDTFILNGTTTIEYLIVGGGGGGTTNINLPYDTRPVGGGGGAGGLLYTSPNSGVLFQAGTYSITVGTGGRAGGYFGRVSSEKGGDSSVIETTGTQSLNLVATGGGAGRNTFYPNGGSGGGASGSGNYTIVGTGIAGQGYQGGQSTDGFGGGGGGAGGPGSNATSSASGRGGPGLLINITGSNVLYAAGGHGSTTTGATQSSVGGSAIPGGSPVTGGGGPGANPSRSALNGGSGIVVLRYRI